MVLEEKSFDIVVDDEDDGACLYYKVLRGLRLRLAKNCKKMFISMHATREHGLARTGDVYPVFSRGRNNLNCPVYSRRQPAHLRNHGRTKGESWSTAN